MKNYLDNYEKGKKFIDINNIGSFLLESGYIPNNIWTKNNSDFFIWNKMDEIISQFEFNQNISPTEADKKYGKTIKWLNKIFEINISLKEFHSQYNHYTSSNISFFKLLNNIIMLEIILKNFYNIINKNNESNINNVFNQKIIINKINNEYSDKLKLIYEEMSKNPTYNGKNANIILIILIYLISFGSSCSIDGKIPLLENLMNLFILYNKVYINDINISFILFLNFIIYLNLFIYANKNKKSFKFLSFNNNNYNNDPNFYQEIKKGNTLDKIITIKQNEEIKNYLSAFIFDNDIISYTQDNFLECLIFQNFLKIFSLYYISQNNIKLTINLTIDTLSETLKTFTDNIIINKNMIKYNMGNNEINIESVKLSNFLILSKENINKCFAAFNFNELLIKITGIQNENQIKAISSRYYELIQKSRKLYFMNSITSINTKNNFISMNDLIKEFEFIKYLLNYFNKNKDIKKYLQFYNFKFTFLKCSIFREGEGSKEIQFFCDYSSIKEKNILSFIKDINNLLFLIKQYEELIEILNEFKLYNIILRVSQTNFISSHVSLFFLIIIKILIIYLDENKFNRISIYDSKLKTFEENILVYVKDNEVKLKSRINYLKKIINESTLSQILKPFNSYLNELAEDWDIIIIGEDIKYNNILYSKNSNILFFNLLKESGSILASFNPSIKVNENNINFEYIDILMYIKDDEEFSEKVLKISEKIKNDHNLIKNRITLVCERFFFEEKIIMNSRVKEDDKKIYNCINNYLLICDSSKNVDIYKYDLYITNKSVSIVNYITQEITNKFDHIINEFISSLSSCVELVLFLLKKKEIEPNKFYYIQKIHNDYYLFKYKEGNIFIKKLETFESLIILNSKKSFPLFCLLKDKQTKDYDGYNENNENFLDLFLRLFLNLNKVVRSKELNSYFFGKIHKNLFFQNYDIFKLFAFSYKAFCVFNDFFINNDYLRISKNDKFEICYILPYEIEQEQKNKEYKRILENKKNDNSFIVKNIKIYDYNLTNSFIFKNKEEIEMNIKKVEFFNEYYQKETKLQNEIKNKLQYTFQKLKMKKVDNKNIKKIMINIKDFYYLKNNICLYNNDISDFEKVLKEFKAEEIKSSAFTINHRPF